MWGLFPLELLGYFHKEQDGEEVQDEGWVDSQEYLTPDKP